MSFETLGLCQPVLRAVRDSGYAKATPIQTQAVPSVLAGRDLMGCAQTGTGKTAAFALPTLHRLSLGDAQRNLGSSGAGKKRKRPIRALVVAPTRELAAQIGVSFAKYGKYTSLRSAVIFGGVGQQPQVRALRSGTDILVATPGRLLDLMNQGHVDLTEVEVLILDEADQMLDMGFLPDMRRIVAATPRRRQTLMFSATMPEEIRRLAQQWLEEPHHVQVAPAATPVESVRQSVYFVDRQHKPRLLAHYLQTTACVRTLVFVRTKHGADKIVKHLLRTGIRAEAIHGNKTQSARTRALERFRSQQPPVLVATDIAARGLDVHAVSHVVNYELPEVAEIYVHRIGRTGRAGAVGIATTFCSTDERSSLKRIERLTRQRINVEEMASEVAPSPTRDSSRSLSEALRSRRGSGGTSQKRRRSRPRSAPRLDEPAKVATAPRSRRRKQRRRAL
jgi:ATP-dependent RNA helicase RhlE